jgi:hypothetical protein
MRKKKKVTPWKDPKTAERWIKTLSEHPDPVAVLRESINNEWTGLFPDRFRKRAPIRAASEDRSLLDREYERTKAILRNQGGGK